MAAPPFSPRHIPVLFIATTQALGGFIPLISARRAMLDFGLPPRIASSPEAQAVMRVGAARTLVTGLTCFMLYSRGLLAELDLVVGTLGACFGAIDAWVCWREGAQGKAMFRGTCGALIAAWGLSGMTSS
jgi:hypothetical protein